MNSTSLAESCLGRGAGATAATRLQHRLALAVVLVPFAGTVFAVAWALHSGINAIEVWTFCVMYVLVMGGVSIGYHRYFTHRAFDTGPILQTILGVLGSIAAQGPLVLWVATHRRHHAFSDEPGDPHSPHLAGTGRASMIRGLWHSHIAWMLSGDVTEWSRFPRDVMRDRRAFRIHRLYFECVTAGLLLPGAVAGLIARSWSAVWFGFLWGGLVRMFVVNQAAWCVGSICHYFGSQRFETHDHSKNNYIVATLTFGEGLQNNHHAFPSAARHGLRWWEPDLSGLVIRLLGAFGLVWNVKHPTRQAIARLRRAT